MAKKILYQDNARRALERGMEILGKKGFEPLTP